MYVAGSLFGANASLPPLYLERGRVLVSEQLIGVDYMAPEWRRMYSFSPYFSCSLLFFPGMISYRFPLTWEVGTAHFFCESAFFAKFYKFKKHSI